MNNSRGGVGSNAIVLSHELPPVSSQCSNLTVHGSSLSLSPEYKVCHESLRSSGLVKQCSGVLFLF